MSLSKSTTITVQGEPLTLGDLRAIVAAAEGLPDDLPVLGSTTSRNPWPSATLGTTIGSTARRSYPVMAPTCRRHGPESHVHPAYTDWRRSLL